MIARCFLALELDEATVAVVRAAQDLIAGDLARKVPMESLHLTVKFLGLVSLEAVARPAFESVAPLVQATPPPALGQGRIDGFPSLAKANVVVLACGDPEMRLAGLASRAEESAASLGVAREARAFRPHVTLARAKDLDVRKLAKRFAARKLGSAIRLTLFESRDSKYASIASVPYTTSK